MELAGNPLVLPLLLPLAITLDITTITVIIIPIFIFFYLLPQIGAAPPPFQQIRRHHGHQSSPTPLTTSPWSREPPPSLESDPIDPNPPQCRPPKFLLHQLAISPPPTASSPEPPPPSTAAAAAALLLLPPHHHPHLRSSTVPSPTPSPELATGPAPIPHLADHQQSTSTTITTSPAVPNPDRTTPRLITPFCWSSHLFSTREDTDPNPCQFRIPYPCRIHRAVRAIPGSPPCRAVPHELVSYPYPLPITPGW